MRGKVVWLPVGDFQDRLIPKPPSRLMSSVLPAQEIDRLSQSFKGMLSNKGYASRAKLKGRVKEEVLAEEFTALINQMVLIPVAEKEVHIDPAGPSAKEPFKLNWKAIKKLSSRITKSGSTVTGAAGLAESSASGPASQPTAPATDSGPDPISEPWRTTTVDKIPSYVMHLSPHKFDMSDASKNKADAAIFRKDANIVPGRPNWVHQRLFLEFKREGTENDPFDDANNKEIEPWAEKRSEVRGQVISYAARVFQYQHRTSVFSLVVLGGDFRAMYWDRSGMFVSEKVNYVTSTHTLVELLVGFLMLDDKSQGIDTTATLLNSDSAEYMEMQQLVDKKETPLLSFDCDFALPPDIPLETITVFPGGHATTDTAKTSNSTSDTLHPEKKTSPKPVQLTVPKERSFMFNYAYTDFRESLKGWPRYKLTIGDDEFLVGRPLYETTSLTGRSTRGYVAYHRGTKSLVFLKDAWRPFYEGMRTEGEILGDLNAKGVKNIPTVLFHGHVDDQVTRISHFWYYGDRKTNESRKADIHKAKEETGGSKGVKRNKRASDDDEDKLPPHIRHYAHYRIAIKEVCLPITAFTSSKQLVSILADCIDAHEDAVQKCRTIHRDISSGNILILPTFVQQADGTLRVRWRGILADWELSKPIAECEADEKARQPERTGTWRYMSVASLLDQFHVVSVADEIESLFNVLLHNALELIPNSLGTTAQDFIKAYFVETARTLAASGIKCGRTKNDVITRGELMNVNHFIEFGTADDRNDALDGLLADMLELFRARYEVIRYEAELKRTEGGGSAEPASTRRRVDVAPGESSMTRSRRCRVPPPSEATRELAARLKDHTAVKKLFQDAISGNGWPVNDAVEDQSTTERLLFPLAHGMEEAQIVSTDDNNLVDPMSVPLFTPPPIKPSRRATTTSGDGMWNAWRRPVD